MPIPPVLRAAHVRRTPADTFRLFTDQIGAWWPLGTHGLFGDRSGGVAFADGALVERSVTGETTVWGEVQAWEPPRRLVLTWHPGRSEGPHSVVEVTFTGDADGTRVEIAHRGWDAFAEGAMAARRGYTGPSAWGGLLDRFGDLADRQPGGVDPDPGEAELGDLTAAYEAFFVEAALGGFGPPTGDEWTAEQVVAHVAVNDDGLAAVCRALLEGPDATFDNAPSMPWGQLATRTQAGFHLPLHTRAATAATGRLTARRLRPPPARPPAPRPRRGC